MYLKHFFPIVNEDRESSWESPKCGCSRRFVGHPPQVRQNDVVQEEEEEVVLVAKEEGRMVGTSWWSRMAWFFASGPSPGSVTEQVGRGVTVVRCFELLVPNGNVLVSVDLLSALPGRYWTNRDRQG